MTEQDWLCEICGIQNSREENLCSLRQSVPGSGLCGGCRTEHTGCRNKRHRAADQNQRGYPSFCPGGRETAEETSDDTAEETSDDTAEGTEEAV